MKMVVLKVLMAGGTVINQETTEEEATAIIEDFTTWCSTVKLDTRNYRYSTIQFKQKKDGKVTVVLRLCKIEAMLIEG